MRQIFKSTASIFRFPRLDHSPGIYLAHRGLCAVVQIQQKQYDAAIASYNQVIQLRPDANAYYYQGIAYLNNNQPEKARANFLKALQLNPKLSEAQQYLDKRALNKMLTFALHTNINSYL
ncbi:MAG: tetratricopeptide repeat protein [Sphingobacteriales bacterium]|nr:tetratricopeptide repeat protein [Sphingobacteriales bacterium]